MSMRIGMVVPTLGERPDLLDECLDSLRRQAGVEQDLVIVTVESAVARLSERYDLPVIAQEGRGLAAAITTGFRHFGDRVDALAWLGDDDRLPAGSLATALTALADRPDCSMVYGQTRWIDDAGEQLSVLRPGRAGRLLIKLGHNLILQPGCVYRRSAIEAIGGIDPGFPLAFDVDLHRRLIGHQRARYVPELLGEAREHPGSLTVRHQQTSQAECEDCLVQQMPGWLRGSRPLWAPAARLAMRATAKVALQR
ncbi:glycosyltransferase [Streptomyces sp. A7024]|uniref:Glycosyltransferase n=1 Tax=Streptomyces coryli TaxID=1128680 RepID=A0A6G4TZ32_9ACTN|nr:glycosyltransferase [Streptomyces coryli]NGN65083.1 glycosyltransferase [Streptomyces coryli]